MLSRTWVGTLLALVAAVNSVSTAAAPMRASQAIPAQSGRVDRTGRELPSRATKKPRESSNVVSMVIVIPLLIGAVVAGAIVAGASSDSNG